MNVKKLLLAVVLAACVIGPVAAATSAPYETPVPTLPTDRCGVPPISQPWPGFSAVQKFLRALGIMTAPNC